MGKNAAIEAKRKAYGWGGRTGRLKEAILIKELRIIAERVVAQSGTAKKRHSDPSRRQRSHLQLSIAFQGAKLSIPAGLGGEAETLYVMNRFLAPKWAVHWSGA